ncbi:MAG: dihydroxy-acid dehydratase [Paenibacillus sp.]|nr:dihydroxy-acid dehydratase [Paenibacillus sp.]
MTYKLRSEEWFRGAIDNSFQHRSAMRAMGHVPESFVGKPMIGIFNSWNDLNSCNYPHKELVEFVKRGVLLAGGYPIELHTITTPADFMKPSDLPYRNLMAMDVEESIRSLPIDGVVMLCECDKTTPAQLMGAASCDLPALQLAAGHRTPGVFRGKTVNYGTDTWKYIDDYKAGLLTDEEWSELEKCISCSVGGCPVMGTASTMKSVSEMLGMMLPGTASIPATHSGRKAAAEATGQRIVEMVRENLTPSKLITEDSIVNVMKLLSALGGSTNAIIHLTAIAGRLGIHIDVNEYATHSAGVPLLVNMQPSGEFNMDDYFRAGGLSVVIRELLPILNGDCLGATGQTIREIYSKVQAEVSEVIHPLSEPVMEQSGIAIVKGNISPLGGILKLSACSEHLLTHRGPAVVFDSYEDMLQRIDDDNLEVDADSVLILRNCGPIAEGMPEWGAIPIPRKLLREGIRDMVRLSDARMSGTSYGTIVLHVAPEATAGGPLAIVQTGDIIELDVPNGSLQVLLEQSELEARMAAWVRPTPKHVRGYPKLYADHVLQASEGCDFDFLRANSKEEAKFVPPIVGRG